MTGQKERAPRNIVVAFGLAALAAMGFAAVYVIEDNVQLLGLCVAVSMGSLAYGLVAWSRLLERHEGVHVEPRVPMPSEPQQRSAAIEALTEQPVPRAKVLWGLLAVTVGTIFTALMFPIRSLYWGKVSPDETLRHTAWKDGRGIVTKEGRHLRPTDLAVGGVVTVFPQSYLSDKYVQAATLLIRVDPQRLRLPPERMRWVVDGVVAYSKICTHAGCPVGLYADDMGLLMCPCHHSIFDVYHGAKPVDGPAARSLPQLPLGVDARGYLIALGDFSAPAGPGWWNYP